MRIFRRVASAGAMAAVTVGLCISAASAATIDGHSYGEVLKGTRYIDTIYGRGGSDTLYGYGEDDRLNAGNGNDTVYGGYGNDMIVTESGIDHVYAGPGNDRILVEIGPYYRDTIVCGDGSDSVTYVGSGLKPNLSGCESYREVQRFPGLEPFYVWN